MKAISYTLIGLLLSIFLPLYVYAYDCPYGKVNDPYPGECGRYIDVDDSGFCDHSEDLAAVTTQTIETTKTSVSDTSEFITGQELKEKTVEEIANLYQIPVDEFIIVLKKQMSLPTLSKNDRFQLLHDNYGVEPSVVKEIAEALALGTNKNQEVQQLPVVQKEGKNYNFGIISIITIILYFVSWICSYKKIITVRTHRRIWNILLGIYFFATACLGILLVLRISYGVIIPIPFNMLFWHVETGIVFSLISVFHIVWHWPYFLALVKKSESET